MKKTMFTLLLVLSGLMSYAQIGKGTVFTGGLLSFHSSQGRHSLTPGDKSRYTSLNILPQAGLFITDRFALGIIADGSYTHNKPYTGSSDPELREWLPGGSICPLLQNAQ